MGVGLKLDEGTQRVTIKWSPDDFSVEFDPPIPFMEGEPVDLALVGLVQAVKQAKRTADQRRGILR